MYRVEDIKCCIQEWFGDAESPIEACKIYIATMLEVEKQLELTINILTKTEDEEE